MGTGTSGLVRLRKDHVKAASQMLARAFHDDPVVKYAYSNPAEMKKRLPYVYEVLLRSTPPQAQAWATSERLEGVAIWTRSEQATVSLWSFLFSGAIWPALRIGIRAARRMRPFFDYVETRRKELVPFVHWYLMVIGVDPEFQGLGHAGRLLRGMLSEVDEQGLPCCLETEKERNVSLYRHFDFAVLDEYVIPDTSVKLWVMLREARTKTA